VEEQRGKAAVAFMLLKATILQSFASLTCFLFKHDAAKPCSNVHTIDDQLVLQMIQVALQHYFCMQLQQNRECHWYCIWALSPESGQLSLIQTACHDVALPTQQKKVLALMRHKKINQQLPKATSVMNQATAMTVSQGKAPGKVCCHGLHHLGQLPDLTDLPFPPKLQSGDCPQQSSFPQGPTETPGSYSDPAHPCA